MSVMGCDLLTIAVLFFVTAFDVDFAELLRGARFFGVVVEAITIQRFNQPWRGGIIYVAPPGLENSFGALIPALACWATDIPPLRGL